LLYLKPDNPHEFNPQRSPQDENLFFIEEAEMRPSNKKINNSPFVRKKTRNELRDFGDNAG